MLTYTLKKYPGMPLYESLYRCIREDILSGVLLPGEKLPSKRALAENLEVSKITVEAAYNQLLSEGFIRSREKVGYFVEAVERPGTQRVRDPEPEQAQQWLLDLTGSGTVRFPFSVWSRLQRQVMLDYGEKLLLPMPNRGIPELRQAISRHLAQFRGLNAPPENILVRCVSASMDALGVRPDSLGDAQVLHISPSHHFPTGLVTTVSRRAELLGWAQSRDGYIIEDDYDSEFRFDARPMPAMQSMDLQGRVIYMNSFSKSLAPSIRISYLVLPDSLMAQFQEKLGFYSCTVPSFEQHTLARFLDEGYFEKHINRMRKFYRSRRNRVIQMLKACPLSHRLEILEQDAGLHFLLRVHTRLSDRELTEALRARGIRVQALSHYDHENRGMDTHCLVVNYAALNEEVFAEVLASLPQEIDD